MTLTKIIFILSISFIAIDAAEIKKPKVSQEDVANALGLKASDYDISKTLVRFEKHVSVSMQLMTAGTTNAQNKLDLAGKHSSVSLLRYTIDTKQDKKRCKFWLSGNNGQSVESSFFFSFSKAKFTREVILNGVFTLQASEFADFRELEYQIQLITK